MLISVGIALNISKNRLLFFALLLVASSSSQGRRISKKLNYLSLELIELVTEVAVVVVEVRTRTQTRQTNPELGIKRVVLLVALPVKMKEGDAETE